MKYSPALMTDMYEYTMLEATLRDGTANRHCTFEVFTRHLPTGRRYGVVAGIGRILEALENFRLDDDDLKFLRDRSIISHDTLTWLENFHFSGTIRGYREGEMFFPQSPILQVEGTFGECTLLETLLLSILNYDCAVASAASRMTTAAQGRPCMDMGGRRTNEWAAVAAARAAIVGGFEGTANLLAAQKYDLPAIGTAAHCFTLVHDSERQAFESQVAALGCGTTLLVDTYNIEEAVRTAVEVAGPNLGGVRIDSGDLASVAQRVRNQLDAMGATDTKITVTNDLDEYAIAALQTAPVDAYGVGTQLVIGSGAPTSSMVYKLTSREGADGHMHGVAKKSTGKASVPGSKAAYRSYDEHGVANGEQILAGSREQLDEFEREQKPEHWRNLLVDYVTDGIMHDEYRGHDALLSARDHHAETLAELPIAAQSMMTGEPVIPTHLTMLND